ncbi:hypothetical protein V2O64_16145 [Verrucomicrobiaceae bacterium 227]
MGLCATLPASSIEIELRYDYDTSGFFDQPGAKEAMRVCADFFENKITDSLTEINAGATGKPQNSWAARPKHPATGETVNIENLIVPADTLIIFLGARDLSGGATALATSGFSVGGFTSFVERMQDRGQIGALSSPATEYGPWGGSIAFDTRLSDGNLRDWNFSTTESVSGKTGFVGVALHELCHLLGIGFGNAWKDQVSDGTFMGEASKIANGGTRPLVDADKGHWIGTSPGPYEFPTYGSFGNPHGATQRVLMNGISRTNLPELAVVTDLEIAALIDVGWEVVLPARGLTTEKAFNGDQLIKFPTNSNFTYRVQRGNLVTPFTNLSEPIEGDGSLMEYFDTDPLAMKGFYRFTISRGSEAAAGARSAKQAPGPEEYLTASGSWESIGCCQH